MSAPLSAVRVAESATVPRTTVPPLTIGTDIDGNAAVLFVACGNGFLHEALPGPEC